MHYGTEMLWLWFMSARRMSMGFTSAMSHVSRGVRIVVVVVVIEQWLRLMVSCLPIKMLMLGRKLVVCENWLAIMLRIGRLALMRLILVIEPMMWLWSEGRR